MPEPVVYVDRFQIRDGKLERFREYASEMAKLVEAEEPDAVSYNYYVDEEGMRGTAIFIFANAEALDAHIELMSSKWQEGVELLGATEIELLGQPSEQAAAMARSFGGHVKNKLAGFSR